MCGLAVVWDPYRNYNKLLKLLSKDLLHRGPDSVNSLALEDQRLFLLHTRLKIIDKSDEANQPFVSPCGRWILVYNGEIYNFKKLKLELSDKWVWKTKSDTEVLLAAWIIWGRSCLEKFNGMFSFVLFDKKNKKLFLIRDRFGIKPLYIYSKKKLIVISSEIQPILKFQDQVLPNENTIRTYLETGYYDHTENTFFRDVYSIPSGSLTSIDLNNEKKINEQWYSLKDNLVCTKGMSENDIIYKAENLIDEAITSNLIADVKTGLNVSGGVDSSMLITMASNKVENLNLFTQDFPGYSELSSVKKISKGSKLHIETLNIDKIESYLLSTVIHQAEPFGGVTVCGYNSIYKTASENNIKVLLDGNGVDEIFLGYQKYHQLFVESYKSSNQFEKIKKQYENFWKEGFQNFNLFSSIDGTQGLQPNAISNYLQNNSEIILSPKFNFQNPVRNLAANDLFFNKIPRGLRFNDRVSMSHSCELRVPFLNHKLVEFAFSIPIHFLLNEKGSKVIFRKILSKYVSKEIAFAKKRSVQSPQREWLGGNWQQLVKDILWSKSFANRQWVEPSKAKAIYLKYLEGSKQNSFFIWQWVNLELWARHYLDKDPIF
ncbi:asparagine synthase (glutamine-hydrolyzing) [Alphaproteobacteria bacterium]|nr:asparagine synthase (glutamine-hydrolyzing) [Alphaproteobacteria bacterium]